MAKKYWLTKEGLEKLKQEHKRLKELRFSAIRGEAPRSFRIGEVDAEYIDFRQEVDRLDLMIAEIEEVLRNYELIKQPPKKEWDKINLGAKVTVEVEGQIDEFVIVGTLEADPAAGKISNESPVGKALVGRKTGEEVIINSAVTLIYRIKKIKYGR